MECPVGRMNNANPLNKRLEVMVETRPWGTFEQFTNNRTSTVKILTVQPYLRLSYQSHHYRDEYWQCIKNDVLAIVGDMEYHLSEGQSLWVPRETKHRLIGTDWVGKVLEISLGEFYEGDITRFQDDFGRIEITK